MFTGIVESVGTVTAADMAEDDGMLLAIDSEQMDLRGLRVGHSVAVNGVCLTVIKIFRGSIFFDVSPETLSISLPLMVGEQVNLEKALSVGGHMGGHYVSGHVDSTVEVKSIKNHGEN